MAILSPFKHSVSLATSGQPVKPVLPVDNENTYAADQAIAASVEPDAGIYQTNAVTIPKGVAANQQAVALATLSPDRAIHDFVSVAVVDAEDASFDQVDGQLKSIFSTSAASPGYGSCSARVEALIYKQRAFRATAAALISGTNTVVNPVGGVVTTYPNRVSVNLPVESRIVNSWYQVISYRWRNGVLPVDPWVGQSDGNPFNFVAGNNYTLAVRVRLSTGATLIGGDWELQYSATPENLGSWNSLYGDVKIVFMDRTSLGIADGDPWPVSAWVTTPGPGSYDTVDGAVVYADNQSVRLIANAPRTTEIEILFYLTLLSDIAKLPYYFRLTPTEIDLGGYASGIRPSTSLLNQPWITAFTP